MLGGLGVSTTDFSRSRSSVLPLFLINKPAMMSASMLWDYSTSPSLRPFSFLHRFDLLGNLVSDRSALDLATLGTLQTDPLLSCLLFWTYVHAIRPVDGSMTSSWLHQDRCACTLLGHVRHWYPWVCTDQAHSHPLQLGPTQHKTRRPDSGPNKPDLWPEDLPEDSSRRPRPIRDLACTPRTRPRRQTVWRSRDNVVTN
jgi:hypothetical protein